MIYTEGCLLKASQWFERHILSVAIVIVVLAVLQVRKTYSSSLHSHLLNEIFLISDTWHLFCSKSSK